MSRRRILELLSAHSPVNSEEAEMRDSIEKFVSENEACFDRTLRAGHITGSAWIVDHDYAHTLLTHHKKLGKWLQLGGHADGESDVLRVALREAREESGLQEIRPLLYEIFDVDVHLIPARKAEPAHFHYDIRFLLVADCNLPLLMSDESKDLRWVALRKVSRLTREESVLRMVRKTIDRRAQWPLPAKRWVTASV